MVEAERKSRHHRDREEWQGVFERFSSSGLSVRAFCQREGLNPSSFQRWRRRLLRQEALPRFVELVPEGRSVVEKREPMWTFELSLPGGVVLRMRA